MSLIWATRGRYWGFRFLLSGGFSDPLLTYEQAFEGAATGNSVIQQLDGITALRFPDPLGRKDRSGRVIPHEFVLTGNEATQIGSVEEGLQKIWPQVSEYYALVWAKSSAPKVDESLVQQQM